MQGIRTEEAILDEHDFRGIDDALENLDETDTDYILALIVGAIRSERFMDGSIKGIIESRTMARLVRMLWAADETVWRRDYQGVEPVSQRHLGDDDRRINAQELVAFFRTRVLNARIQRASASAMPRAFAFAAQRRSIEAPYRCKRICNV